MSFEGVAAIRMIPAAPRNLWATAWWRYARNPVRVLAAEPETERLARRHAFQERREILIGGARRIVLAAAVLEIARSPSFSFKADVVIRLRQQVGIHWKLVGPAAPQIRAVLQSPEILSGEQRAARRRAARRRAERVSEIHALASHPVEVWGAADCVAVCSEVRPRGIVRDAKQNVGTRIGGASGKSQCAN